MRIDGGAASDGESSEPPQKTVAVAVFAPSGYLMAGIGRVTRLMRGDAEWRMPPDPPRVVPGGGATAEMVLEAMIQSEEPVVRQRAMEGLKSAAMLGAEPHYVQALADPDPQVRQAAFQEMGKNAPQELVEYVLETLGGGMPEAVAGVDMALPELRAVLEPPLQEIFTDRAAAPLRRRSAAYALGRIGTRGAAPALNEAVWAEGPEMAFTCAQALYAVRDAVSADVWAKLLEHPEPVIRGMAADALADIGGQAAHDILVGVVFGERAVELPLQAYVVRAMYPWPAAELYPLLIEIMRRNAPLRPVAAAALKARTKQDFGEDPGKWQEWLEQPPPSSEGEELPDPAVQYNDPTIPQPKAPPIWHEPVVRKSRR